MPKSWSKKDERQYEHVKSSEKKQGRSSKRATQIAAAIVNKQRSKEGRTKDSKKSSGRSKSRSRTEESSRPRGRE